MATTSRVSQASAELACSPRRSGENLPEETSPEHQKQRLQGPGSVPRQGHPGQDLEGDLRAL